MRASCQSCILLRDESCNDNRDALFGVALPNPFDSKPAGTYRNSGIGGEADDSNGEHGVTRSVENLLRN